MNDIELLPCPFCGGPAEIRDAFYDGPMFWGACISCDVAAGTHHDPLEAIAAWNRRAAPAPITPTDMVAFAQLQNED